MQRFYSFTALPYVILQPDPVVDTVSIIFLDIDGVLNTLNHLERQKKETGIVSHKIWCPIACKHIVLLCKTYNARIVISSSWRHEYNITQLKELFKSNNIPPAYIIDLTPSTAPQSDEQNYCRGHEIRHWLNNFPEKISSFVIIDDAETVLEDQQSHLVRVDEKRGFSTREMAIKASDILANRKIEVE